MTDNILEFNYDWLCYIKASKEACENNHEYIKRSGSKLNYYIDCDKVSGFEYDDVGGDCSGFTQGVVYTLSKGERGQEGEDPNILSDTTGLWNHNVSSGKLVYGSYDTDESMLRLGWDKYYLDGKVWKIKSMIDDEIRINTLKETIGYEMSELGVDFLEPGDLLCSTGHAEFYIGYEYSVDYNIEKDKSSGIKSITRKGKAKQGYSTFGWGNVQNEFPKQQYNFIYDSNGSFRLKQVSSVTENKYNVIWRKN